MTTDSHPQVPISGSPVVPNMVDGTHKIQFSCRKGISCWNACCSNIDISLTPYDVIRLKTRLGVASAEFLKEYTVPYELEKDDIAGVKFRPVENGTACRFMTPEGCSVYEDRPTACRYYPVALLSMRKQDEYVDRDSYAIVEEPHCLGHQEPRTLTIDEYRAEQGVAEYDELARGWRQLILKKKSSGPSVGKPSLKSRQLFFMACYDVDTFRAFVASEGFGKLFKLRDDERAMLMADDTELMLFAFRFLKQVLFGEQSIELDEATAKERLESWRERQKAIEREAARKLMNAEEGMIEATDECVGGDCGEEP
ncbi:MAG: YkgJ family cysteine cluster protein [Candidatus Nitricoxidivorans perseverans]|uniref:YkgJ family cysteine cluster protein n=1 Tax=Candidatus Nitricoxidivorans perseverans TaxID=2975601 RepID=A0AA49IXY3_9PROT|nr:MAG: YkgJ family cysteine cluster protein [Candidatus Nitricoxidivorans perseverans]